ncbi:hypothetical protein RF11_04910 [Thelohanellus kitauei]|uniref:Tc1-like transposase DDE domain-containing protein n=1 Tax=Thelohanellus kitauei TaxID=669202 RepID=A0A0C2NE63_THEKT|nr:hypothetical protein RF11_05230 [Thelohanellus kitauei]KII74807.1 hypothetical protein RF11_04910 [Thelohanellus kitauei]
MESIENTNSERRTYKKLSTDVKMLAISYIQRNPEKSTAEVATNLSLNERTLRYPYSKFLRDVNVIKKVIYIDETGFNLHIRRRYGRSQIGERSHIVVANSRGRSINVSAAMNISGFMNCRSIVASFNKNEFCQFLRECFQNLSKTPKIFVMDNVHFHHSIEVREVVESQGPRIVFIPPYSPQLNPIELLFLKWKNIFKQLLPRSGDDGAGWIREATRFASRSLQPEHC